VRIVLLGAPGAGKGTQAVRLSEFLDLPHISTGDLFRDAIKNKTQLGLRVKQYIDKGMLVPDEVVLGCIAKRLSEPDVRDGFILDGFPRTVPQAEGLGTVLHELGMSLDHVINIDSKESTLIKRLTGRRMCSGCGANYHILNSPPRIEGECDVCSGKLYTRSDDNEETARKRLGVYREQTEPLIKYYSDRDLLRTVDGDDHIDKVFESIRNLLEPYYLRRLKQWILRH
jgi:adenylate kinase